MKVSLLIIFILFACIVRAEMCADISTNYYRSAELNQFPAEPFDPITVSEANRLEEEGSEYYIHILCGSGKPISLTKRWNKKLYFEIKYLYRNGVLIGQKSTNSKGEINEYYIE